MSRLLLRIIILLGLSSAFLSAEPVVTFTAPHLKPGMASLEAMLQSSAEEFSGDIETIVANALNKPAFMQGFGGAAANTVLIPSAVKDTSQPSIYVGSTASVYSKNLSPSLASHIRSLNAESDEKLGAPGRSNAFMCPLWRTRSGRRNVGAQGGAGYTGPA